METRYRIDYPGEFVITRSVWSGGKKTEEREWIPNPIENQHISGRAACIGTNTDRIGFNYTILQRHRGGLLGSKKLQTYGTGVIAEEMRLDFAVENNSEQLTKLIEVGYPENNVVYTSARNCIAYPGEFYLVPLNPPHLLTPIVPVYLACFDDHREIFLLGYTNDAYEQIGNDCWVNQLFEIIQAYSSNKFYIVGEQSNIPEKLFDLPNVAPMSHREFISYADV